MTGPIEVKKNIKEIILSALKRDGIAEQDVLVASISLETGFTEKTILGIMNQMVTAKMIQFDGNKITLAEQGNVQGVAE